MSSGSSGPFSEAAALLSDCVNLVVDMEISRFGLRMSSNEIFDLEYLGFEKMSQNRGYSGEVST